MDDVTEVMKLVSTTSCMQMMMMMMMSTDIQSIFWIRFKKQKPFKRLVQCFCSHWSNKMLRYLGPSKKRR